jgi:hypothetical protein
MTIAQLDPADSVAMGRWFDLMAAVTRHDLPDFPAPSPREHAARFEHPWPASAEEVRSLPGGVARDEAGYRWLTDRAHRPGLTSIRYRYRLGDRPEGDEVALADGYSLVRWLDAVPGEIIGDIAALQSRLTADAPTGDLTAEQELHDADRVRAQEATQLGRGHHWYSTAARHDATGRIVARTKLSFEEEDDTHARQRVTIVEPAHRSRRLGLAVKAANHAYARGHEPALRVIESWNAEENTHMRAVNCGICPISKTLLPSVASPTTGDARSWPMRDATGSMALLRVASGLVLPHFASHLVFHLAEFRAGQGVVPGWIEGTHVSQADGPHDAPRPGIHGHRLRDHAALPDGVEGVPQKGAGRFAGQALPPEPADKAVTEFGLERVVGPIGAVGRRKHHEPDEGGVGLRLRCRRTAPAAIGSEGHPVAQAVDLSREGDPLRVGGGHLRAGPGSPVEVTQHLSIGVESNLELEVPVGQRNHQETGSAQNRLRHPATITHRRPPRDGICIGFRNRRCAPTRPALL